MYPSISNLVDLDEGFIEKILLDSLPDENAVVENFHDADISQGDIKARTFVLSKMIINWCQIVLLGLPVYGMGGPLIYSKVKRSQR